MVCADNMFTAYFHTWKLLLQLYFILGVYTGGWVHSVLEEDRGQLAGRVGSLCPCRSQESQGFSLGSRLLYLLSLNVSFPKQNLGNLQFCH